MLNAGISFFTEGVRFTIPNPRKTKTWLTLIAREENRTIKSLSYIFCTDKYLLSLNTQFLNHSTYTDILSFDSSDGRDITGEIFISIPRVRENAKLYDQTFESELRRVMAHGLLHFLGYFDKSKTEKANMRLKEEACLSLWK